MKKMILTLSVIAGIAVATIAGCGNSSIADSKWVNLPDGYGKVMCASMNGYGVSCDWEHAELTSR